MWKSAPWRANGFWDREFVPYSCSKIQRCVDGNPICKTMILKMRLIALLLPEKCSVHTGRIYAFSQDSLEVLGAVAEKERRIRREGKNSMKFVSSMHFGRIDTRCPTLLLGLSGPLLTGTNSCAHGRALALYVERLCFASFADSRPVDPRAARFFFSSSQT